MRVTAMFSEGLRQQLAGRAIGDEFEVKARARIVGAEEVLVDVTAYGSADATYLPGELEVKLLLSRAEVS